MLLKAQAAAAARNLPVIDVYAEFRHSFVGEGLALDLQKNDSMLRSNTLL